ncbi:putative O-glycosylation ligase, exosortase A system-associated [Sphingomonas jatrophae]|uniref:Probable O-glycosylation ligase, exosortase A-associated n=1 Tax=Sphingomonas jatrophae TaxID=1166337 RepID=A0A1I6LHM1_9SPHN|nr:putative O-glycosylation ligase, exosortase A system-associated [Sphingomonas jatrophae]SFS02863.1 probable O-glycosylation ligase, exosortase A-associated [Sphingomonas jatrophae]
MRDLALVGFLLMLFGLGFRRPFLFVIAYVYIDIVSPQRLTYFLLNAVPVSLIAAALAVGGWAVSDDKSGTRFSMRQVLLVLLLAWCSWTTINADLPDAAPEKWEWVWKALAFAIFLPLTLRTRVRMEGLALAMVFSASSIIVVGGVKTLASGGGYGSLNLMVDNNSGLYEGSIISAVAVAIIPLILWLARYGTIFPPDWRVRTYAGALIFSCLLIPVGTQARTGLICIGLLAVLMLRSVKRRVLYLMLLGAGGMIALQFLPAAWFSRMDTIAGYQSDQSASTRLAVWAWTWDYVKENPMGGGFEVYRQNKLKIDQVATEKVGGTSTTSARTTYDAGRAFHSSYFEMLGEQGFPGFLLWIALHVAGMFRMEVLRRRYARAGPEDAWIAPLATALQHGHLIYLVGGAFVGIAFQPFVYMLVALEIGFDNYCRRRGTAAAKVGWGRPAAAPFGAPPVPSSS